MIKKFINHYLYVTIILVFITVLFTYPIAFNMTTSFYGYPGDIFGTIWYLWWFKYSIFELNISPLFSPFLGAPNGIYTVIYDPEIDLIAMPFTILFGEIFSYNFLVLLSFILSGIGMYSLAYYLTKNKYASLVSGIIFAFSPYHIAHAMGHLKLAQIQWIPFCILYMLKLDEERSYKNAVIFGIFLTLVIFSNPYYALFIVLLILFYVSYRAYTSNLFKTENLIPCFNSKNLKITGIILAILAGASLVVYYFFIRPAFVSSQEVVNKRDLYELVVYSAKPWDFFLPPIYHPVFGQYVREFVSSHLYGSNPVEQTLYIGYTPLFLATYATLKSFKTKNEDYPVVILFILLGLFVLSFMSPAYLPVFGLKIPFSFSYLLYQITPAFRVMARFDVIIMVSVSILAGIGVKYLLQERFKKWKSLFVISVILIILFEFTPIPSNSGNVENKFHTTKIIIPEEYNWLANQKGDFTIIEYPLAIAPGTEEIVHYRYMFYQRIHKKKLINGGPEGIMRSLAEINKTSPASKLNEMGVKYALVHTNMIGTDINVTGFNLIKKFNDTLILEPYG